jgi:hypothetical protein
MAAAKQRLHTVNPTLAACSGTSSKRGSVCPSEHHAMSYKIDIDLQAQHDISALSAKALPALAEAMTPAQPRQPRRCL